VLKTKLRPRVDDPKCKNWTPQKSPKIIGWGFGKGGFRPERFAPGQKYTRTKGRSGPRGKEKHRTPAKPHQRKEEGVKENAMLGTEKNKPGVSHTHGTVHTFGAPRSARAPRLG